MTIHLAAPVANSMATTITTAIDAGTGPGTIKVYTGAMPATPETAASGTLLATFTLVDPSLESSASGGVATLDFNPDITASVVASGTAGWFRIADSAGNPVLDGSVGTSGQDMNFTSTSWVSGGTVTLTTGTVTVPLS